MQAICGALEEQLLTYLLTYTVIMRMGVVTIVAAGVTHRRGFIFTFVMLKGVWEKILYF